MQHTQQSSRRPQRPLEQGEEAAAALRQQQWPHAYGQHPQAAHVPMYAQAAPAYAQHQQGAMLGRGMQYR